MTEIAENNDYESLNQLSVIEKSETRTHFRHTCSLHVSLEVIMSWSVDLNWEQIMR